MTIKSNIQYLIFEFISHCYDEYGFLPQEDDVYIRFQIHFDNGVPFEIAEDELRKFARCHDLTDIDIRWEGELNEFNSGRIKAHTEIP